MSPEKRGALLKEKIMERSELVGYVVSLAFLMHGLVMVGDVYFVFTNRSWLLSVGLIWVISGITFIGAA